MGFMTPWQMGNMACGYRVQPLQSVNWYTSRARGHEQLRTLARLNYGTKFNLSFALHGIIYCWGPSSSEGPQKHD
jgi:hypothetical protein